MRITAFVVPSMHLRITHALDSLARTTFARTFDDLIRACAERRLDFVVVDPMALLEHQFTHLIATVAASSTPVIWYTAALGRGVADRLLVAAKAQLGEVVLYDVDDDIVTMAAVVALGRDRSYMACLLHLLAPRLTVLAPRARCSIVGMLAARRRDTTVSMCARFGVSRRSLDRWLAAASLRPTARVLVCSQVLNAIDVAARRITSLKGAAESAGFASYVAMSRATSRVLRMSPRDALATEKHRVVIRAAVWLSIRGSPDRLS